MEAIVLRTYPYRDSDLIVRILTKNRGKLSLLAKFARKSKRRFSGSFEPFDIGNFDFKENDSDLFFLNSYKSTSAFRGIRENLDRYQCCLLISEAYDHLIAEGVSDSGVLFQSLSNSLKDINDSDEIKAMLKSTFFALRSLLLETGFHDETIPDVASAKHLKILIDLVEYYSERGLETKSLVDASINEVRLSG